MWLTLRTHDPILCYFLGPETHILILLFSYHDSLLPTEMSGNDAVASENLNCLILQMRDISVS